MSKIFIKLISVIILCALISANVTAGNKLELLDRSDSDCLSPGVMIEKASLQVAIAALYSKGQTSGAMVGVLKNSVVNEKTGAEVRVKTVGNSLAKKAWLSSIAVSALAILAAGFAFWGYEIIDCKEFFRLCAKDLGVGLYISTMLPGLITVWAIIIKAAFIDNIVEWWQWRNRTVLWALKNNKLKELEAKGGNVVAPLIAALADGDKDIAANAAEVLSKIGDEEGSFYGRLYKASEAELEGNVFTPDFIRQAILHDNRTIKLKAIKLAGNTFSDNELKELLIPQWGHAEREVNIAILKAMGNLDFADPDIVDVCVEGLRYGDPFGNNPARDILASKDSRVIDGKLIELLKGNRNEMKMLAAEIMGKKGKKEFVESLIDALTDNNDPVGISVAYALKNSSDERGRLYGDFYVGINTVSGDKERNEFIMRIAFEACDHPSKKRVRTGAIYQILCFFDHGITGAVMVPERVRNDAVFCSI